MKEVLSQIKGLAAGDLVMLEWHDASIGKSLSNGVSGIDVPVKSWGVYIGTLGQKRKHIILAQNCFRYSDGLYDIDYTAIPVPWTTSATVIAKAHVAADEAKQLLNSFLVNDKSKGDKPTLGRCLKQQRVRNHD
ncbi:hypothetical protein G4O51_05280 [Candidatus Bathyarchaeota archaeon A05DMB-2]|jgi:hypothetical protein|nr:hypothetical protein [Candidatus Bathyarchaeota archaeon A05DMB-2]